MTIDLNNISIFKEHKLDSLKQVADAKLKSELKKVSADSTVAMNKVSSAITAFEDDERLKGDEAFQARVESAGGWEAIYNSLDKFQKGELQDSDTDFNIADSRIRGNMLHNQETTRERPKGADLRAGTYDSWAPEFEGYLLNELNPIADTHYNRENPFLSIFGVDPSTANPDGIYTNPYKATHEYIKREMGQDNYDSLIAKAEQKFLKQKGFDSMDEWKAHELRTRRDSEIEGLKNYSYRDKKNVLLPLLEKMEADAKIVALKTNIVKKSQNVSPAHTTKAGANLQKTYEAQLDSIYQQSPQLKQALNQGGSDELIDVYDAEGYGAAGVSAEDFLKDQGLPY